MADLSRNEAALSSAVVAPWLTIIGIGEDGRAGLSPAALRALAEAELVVGGRRHLGLAAPIAGETVVWPSPIEDGFPLITARRGRNVVVLASGDPFHYGVGVQLAALVPVDEMRVIPHLSAFALACARLGWAQQDCALVSLHGRALEKIVPHLQPRARILALSWDGVTPEKLATLLAERGMGQSVITVLEAMGGPRERIRRAPANAFGLADIDPLNLVAIEVVADPGARVIPLSPGLDDDWFETDGQLTKAEVRAVTLAALAPRAGELLWDVGAGSGSIGIEWCLRHPANRAIAIEDRAERSARIGRNAAALGATGVTVVDGVAPGALGALVPPDAVFIGGGIADPAVFDTCWVALRSGGRLVANVVTLEGEARLADLFGQHGGTMRRLGVERLDAVGGMHGWRPAMRVTQWCVVKP
jgi:precorrin-6Y C5,15-methyltransferase (decarboxylating)